MADQSTFRSTLGFLEELGIYDVILPFLLVFTIMFALLEKTRVFGTDKVGENEYPKKHLNSLASFAVALFVVVSSRLVEIIISVSANVVLLVLAGLFFLLLAGSFHQQKPEGFFLEGRFKNLFMIVMFIGLVFIFLNAIKTDGRSWLEWVFNWLRQFTDNVSVSAIVLVIVIVAVMYYIGAVGKESGAAHSNGENK